MTRQWPLYLLSALALALTVPVAGPALGSSLG
jgi:hypothetical protein